MHSLIALVVKLAIGLIFSLSFEATFFLCGSDACQFAAWEDLKTYSRRLAVYHLATFSFQFTIVELEDEDLALFTG